MSAEKGRCFWLGQMLGRGKALCARCKVGGDSAVAEKGKEDVKGRQERVLS